MDSTQLTFEEKMNSYKDAVKISVYVDSDHSNIVNIDYYPEDCPYCHRGIEPISFLGYINKDESLIKGSFQCPRAKCREFFIAEYTLEKQYKELGFSQPLFLFNKYLTGNPNYFSTPEEIRKISPMFHEIYNQGLNAEFKGLDEIAGMGMRKALEFLVKDYCIEYLKKNKEEIQKLELGKCIQNHIDNPKVKDISSRAAWLGNDQSHYYKKWPEKSTGDFKELIEAMIHYIELELIHKKATGMTGRK